MPKTDEYMIHALTTQFYAVWEESEAVAFRKAMDFVVEDGATGRN